MRFRLVPLMLAAALTVFQSCLIEDMRASQYVFEVADLTVPADNVVSYGTGTGTLTVQVPVRCTENWSARVADGSPWLRIVAQDGANPIGADVTGDLTLACDFNDAYTPRSAVLQFVVAGGEHREVTVTQLAKADRISVDGQTAFSLGAESEMEIKIKLLSNTDWTVEADPAQASVSPSEGRGDAIVVIKPKPNYSCTEGTETTVRFHAGQETAVVTISRPADAPFISANAVELRRNYMPSVTEGVLRINSNAPWKAEVLSSSISGFALQVQEGEGAMNTEIPFTMSPNTSDESLRAEVKFSLVSQPQKSVVLTVNQWTGFTVEVDFSNVTDVQSCPLQPAFEGVPQLPYTSADAMSLNSKGEEWTYKFVYAPGKECLFGIKGDLLNVQKTYMRFNNSAAAYVKFPAFEGYKLAYVSITSEATNKSFLVTQNAEGTVVIGTRKTLNKGDVGAWEFEETEYNTPYYLIVSSGKSRLGKWILLYVK